MSEAPDRVLWSLWRRRALARTLPGFWASFWSYASADCTFSPCNRIYRRAFSSIGPNVLIGGLGWHPSDRLSTHPAFYSALRQAGKTFVADSRASELPFTSLGSDVWIGAGCIVLDGVSIGDGVIVAAGAVVTKPVAPYWIVGGVPARPIRPRFDPVVIAELLEWRWWELDDDVLQSVAKEFFAPRQWTEARIRMLRSRTGSPEVQASRPMETAL